MMGCQDMFLNDPRSNSPARKRPVPVIPVILWKQYSGRKIFGFFPMLSSRILPEITGSWQESAGQFPAGIIDLGLQIINQEFFKNY
jgi:hypothetical protein